MNESELRDLERRLSASLHASAPRPAPDLADRLLRRTAVLEQRRGFFGLSIAAAIAAAAVVVLAVALGLGLGYLLPRSGFVGGPSESPAPSSSPPPPTSLPAATPSATPEPTQPATPEPSPSPVGFEGGNQCTNEEFGFTISYPGDWWANEPQAFEDPVLTDIPGCIVFAEEPVEIRPNSELPPEVAISVGGPLEEPLGNPDQPIQVLSERETTVDGLAATVTETEWTEDTPFQRAGDRSYRYEIVLPSGERIGIGTGTDAVTTAEQYESYKRVLDRMIETVDFVEG